VSEKKGYELNAEPGEYGIEGHPIPRSVGRVLDEVRLALLGLLISIGLTVGLGVPGNWYVRVAAGLGATIVAAAALRSRRSQRWLAQLMHWLLGR
jgi:hypothetical protein